MTKEEETQLHKVWTKKMVDIMQAYVNDKEIEERCGLGNWHDCAFPTWDWMECDYRIKGE